MQVCASLPDGMLLYCYLVSLNAYEPLLTGYLYWATVFGQLRYSTADLQQISAGCWLLAEPLAPEPPTKTPCPNMLLRLPWVPFVYHLPFACRQQTSATPGYGWLSP